MLDASFGPLTAGSQPSKDGSSVQSVVDFNASFTFSIRSAPDSQESADRADLPPASAFARGWPPLQAHITRGARFLSLNARGSRAAPLAPTCDITCHLITLKGPYRKRRARCVHSPQPGLGRWVVDFAHGAPAGCRIVCPCTAVVYKLRDDPPASIRPTAPVLTPRLHNAE